MLRCHNRNRRKSKVRTTHHEYRPRCTCEKTKDKTPYCRSVAVWISGICNTTKRTFDYKQAEKVYTMFLHFEAPPDKAKNYKKSLDQINKDLERLFPGKSTLKGLLGMVQQELPN